MKRMPMWALGAFALGMAGAVAATSTSTAPATRKASDTQPSTLPSDPKVTYVFDPPVLWQLGENGKWKQVDIEARKKDDCLRPFLVVIQLYDQGPGERMRLGRKVWATNREDAARAMRKEYRRPWHSVAGSDDWPALEPKSDDQMLLREPPPEVQNPPKEVEKEFWGGRGIPEEGEY